MEKIGIALAQLERIKTLLANWQQKKSISSIERNIILNQLASLYDELMNLNTLESKTPSSVSSKAQVAEEPKEENTLVEEIETIVIRKEEGVTVAKQVAPVEEKKDVDTVAIKKVQNYSDAKQESKDTTVRLADKFVGIHKYLYENFENQDNSSSLRFSSIDDINRAIGINDRFLFINELFKGDKDLFNKTISALNGCSSLDDALMYIHENFSWDSEDSVVKQLIFLLYRRFK